MDSQIGQNDPVRSQDALTARVLADAKRSFSGEADAAILEQIARDTVDELYRDSIKVTTFIPVLAMRRVRDLLEPRSPDIP